MANNRLRGNFLSGTVADNPLLVGATTLNSAALATVPVVANGDYLPITFDPAGINGAPEIAYITAHTSAAATATIQRAREGTGARQHATGVTWINSPTTEDFRGVNKDRTYSRGSTAHALDDEFDDGVLDPAWVRYDIVNAGTNVYTEGADCLSMYDPGGDTADRMAHVLAKPLGGLTFPITIEAGFRFLRRYATNYQMFGLCMTDGLVAASRGLWMMPFSHTGVATAWNFSTRSWTAIGSVAGVSLGDENWELIGGPLHMRMRWSAANTFQAFYSVDAVTWIQRAPTTNMSFTLTPTHIGVCQSTWGGANPVVGTVDYFRVTQA